MNAPISTTSRPVATPVAPRIKRSEVEISTHEYEFAHGRLPRGRGSWAFQMGKALWWAQGSHLYSEACRQARVEAQRRGVTFVSVAT